MNKNKRMVRKLITSLLMFGLLAFGANTAVAKDQANEFLNAYKALSKGKLYASDHLKGYILHPYLEHQRVKKNLKTSSTVTLKRFIKKNKNSWLADDINNELIARLGKQKQWSNVLKHFKKDSANIKAKCVGFEANLRIRPSQEIQNEALKLWLSANRRPKECNSLFALMRNKGIINEQRVWERITLAMDKGRTSLSRDLSKYLKEPSLVSLWIQLRKNPSTHLSNSRLKRNDARSRQLIAYGIQRIARKNTHSARQKWAQFQRSHTFTGKEKSAVESYIAVRDALDHNPRALQKLAAIPANLRSQDANIWTARMALRQGHWKHLRAAINAMSNEDKNKDRWVYWRAISGERLKEPNAKKHLHKISKNASFYGFLAADKLKQPYARLDQAEPNWGALTPKIRQMPSIQRATELFRIRLPELAKKEWFWTLKKLNKQDKLTAAAYALEINQPFLAIITVSKTKDWNQVGLRFPLKYKELVRTSARKHGIIPAWVYGIMRRESAFDPQIVSSANAKGLMQVLPSTAKGVAKKLGIRGHRTTDLMIPEKNANIGAAYLSQMLKRFKGNYIKATAAYNAGPHRIPRWTPKRPIPAQQWIESIPFNETRNYVRAVMSYTTIYDYKLYSKNHSNLRLSQRLRPIGPH